MTTIPKRFVVELTEDEVRLIGHMTGITCALMESHNRALNHSFAYFQDHLEVWNNGLSAKLLVMFKAAGMDPGEEF